MPRRASGPFAYRLLLALLLVLATILATQAQPRLAYHDDAAPGRVQTPPRSSARPSHHSDKIAAASRSSPALRPKRQAPRPIPSTPATPVSPAPTTAQAPALPVEFETSIPEDTIVKPETALLPGAEAVLLEVQLGRLARRVLKMYWMDQQLLLPVAEWLQFAEVRHQVTGRGITGRLEPGAITFALDPDSGSARLGRNSLALREGDLKVVEGRLHASLRLMSRLFGINTSIEQENATLLVSNPEQLPIARRLRRDAARAIQVGGESSLAPELVHRGDPPARPGFVLAYEVRGSSQNPAATSSYDIGVGMGLARGSAVIRGRGVGDTPPEIEGAWSRGWPERRWLTQLRLGDGPTTGPRPLTSRGVSLTNAPIHRALLVEDLPFAGTLPPDWSVEAYRAGLLVAFDSVDASGRYSMTLPIQYGENPVDLVAYGPFGEVRTFNRTFRALPLMVRSGVLEYGVSAGECRTPRCRAAANLDLAYGVSPRWTVRAGLDQLWGNNHSAVSHPYAGLIATPINPLGVELEGVANLLHRAGVRFEPSLHLRLTADYVSYADSGGSSLFLPPTTREQWSLYGRVMPGRRIGGGLILEAQGTRTLTSSGAQRDARIGASVQRGSLVLRPYLRSQRMATGGAADQREYLGLQTTLLPLRALGPVLGRFWLQGQGETEIGGSPTSAGVVIARNLGRAFRIEGGARWEKGLSAPMLTFSLVSQLNAVRATSLITAPTTGEAARLDQTVGGAVVWSRGSGTLALSSEPSLDRAGVGGRVFLDLNGNSEWDRNEPPLPGTRLLVGNRWVTADSAGQYQLWGVSPYEEILVSVDSTSLRSPWWVPRFPAQAVTPTPNLVRGADVPVDIGGVIEGTLVVEGAGSQPLSGPVPLVLIELNSGTRTTVESFSDGSFYRMGLRPGRYEAVIEDRALERLGLTADTLRFELRPGRSAAEPGQVLSDLRLMVRQR